MLKYIEFITESKKAIDHPFILAAKRGSATKVKEFIKSGVDINMQDSDKRTALMYAALDGFLIIVNILIEAGADVNITDYQHRTALMMSKTNSVINKILTVQDIDVNIQDDKGNTIMLEQLVYTYNVLNIIGLLKKFITKGLNLDIKNNYDRNFYEELEYKKINTIESDKVKLNEIIKYMDEHFPKYKEEWDKNKWDTEWYWKYHLNQNIDKFNI